MSSSMRRPGCLNLYTTLPWSNMQGDVYRGGNQLRELRLANLIRDKVSSASNSRELGPLYADLRSLPDQAGLVSSAHFTLLSE